MRRATTRAATAGVVALGASVASAQPFVPLYEQHAVGQPATGYFSDGADGQYYEQRVADNFTVNASNQATHVSFRGSSEYFLENDYDNVLGFEITIYLSEGGRPGTVVYSEYFDLLDTDPAPTGNTNPFDGFEFEHLAMFTTPVGLVGGVEYWLSIGAVLINPFSDAWVWSNSVPADGRIAANFFDGGGWSAFDDEGDVAFAIIPTPGAAVVLALGAMLAGRGRRAAQVDIGGLS